MSGDEQILLSTGPAAEETARRLAAARGEFVRLESGEPAVFRPTTVDPERSVGGEVSENDYGETEPAPGDESIYDGYDTVVDLWTTGRADDGLLHEEAGRLFAEITGALPWPAVHLSAAGLVYSAWSPALGRTDFPPRTPHSGDGRRLWASYAHPGTGG
jgi:hypothetical protein